MSSTFSGEDVCPACFGPALVDPEHRGLLLCSRCGQVRIIFRCPGYLDVRNVFRRGDEWHYRRWGHP